MHFLLLIKMVCLLKKLKLKAYAGGPLYMFLLLSLYHSITSRPNTFFVKLDHGEEEETALHFLCKMISFICYINGCVEQWRKYQSWYLKLGSKLYIVTAFTSYCTHSTCMTCATV